MKDRLLFLCVGIAYIFTCLLHYNIFMPTVRFPAVMKYYVNNQAEFAITASSVQDLIEQVVQQYPSVKFHLLDSEGQLRRHFNIFVNGVAAIMHFQ